MSRLRNLFVDLLGGLWFVPGVLAAAYAVLAVALVEVDKHTHLAGGPLFEGDGPAARTVLSVIAGSLITVAGLILSITVLVLQLASSQFSPRMLRTFFGDRLTQIMLGSYVGIFVFSILVLRSIGGAFVPRLGVSVASTLAVVSVVLLVVFIHHVSQLIEVSHVTGDIAAKTLQRLEALYPRDGSAASDAADELRRSEPPGCIRAHAPGYVRRIELDNLLAALGDDVDRADVLVRPGDFVSGEEALVAIWPAGCAGDRVNEVRKAFRIERERDLEQDLAFGLRQLVDTAVKAMSPGISDPTTACTCVGYIRSILVSLADRPFPRVVRRYPERLLTLVVRRREFEEHIEALAEVARYSVNDTRVTRAVLEALQSVHETASRAGYASRAASAGGLAATVAATALEAAPGGRDRELLKAMVDMCAGATSLP